MTTRTRLGSLVVQGIPEGFVSIDSQLGQQYVQAEKDRVEWYETDRKIEEAKGVIKSSFNALDLKISRRLDEIAAHCAEDARTLRYQDNARLSFRRKKATRQ